MKNLPTDLTRSLTTGHLASWAKVSPVVCESAGKKTGKNTTGRGRAAR